MTIYCFFQISRFLDVAKAYSMPNLLRNLIMMILFFYRTLLSCLEAEKSVKINFISYSAIISYQSLNSSASQIFFVAPISWKQTIMTFVFGDNLGKKSIMTFLSAYWRKYFGCRIWIQKDDDIFNQHSWTKYKIRAIHLFQEKFASGRVSFAHSDLCSQVQTDIWQIQTKNNYNDVQYNYNYVPIYAPSLDSGPALCHFHNML